MSRLVPADFPTATALLRPGFSSVGRGLLFVLLAACATVPKDSADTGDDSGGQDTDSGDTADTAEAADDDKDGYDTTVDCNDHNFAVHPDAAEACNGVDDDCDTVVDNGFDADADGATDAAACEDGTDCDDTDDTVYLGADEVPYDGLDQDCDGEDLIDVDGDRYDYTFDCDDTVAEVNPGATEVPKNGVDDDCDGADAIDGDADGYDDEAWGGDDCDDASASVHPDARDLWGDGLDADCDSFDGGIESLASAPVTIDGDSGEQGLVGESVTWCDLDEDGLDDLLVTAPFGGSYAGRIGIWYGAGEPSWTSGMLMTDADTLIESNDQFLGFGLRCADLDGDGHLDMLTARGEISYGSTYDTDYELVFFYGTGSTLPATLDETDSDATLTYDLGAGYAPTVYSQAFVTEDLDGDGAAEVLVNDSLSDALTNPTGNLLLLRGGRYSGRGQLEDSVIATLDTEGEGAGRVHLYGDLDGDSNPDFFLGQPNFEPEADTGDTGDTAGDSGTPTDTGLDTGTTPMQAGRALFADSSMVDAVVSDLAWRTWSGRDEDGYGWDLALGDFTADGTDDAAVAAIGTGDYGGALYFFDGLPEAGSPADATAELLGSTPEGYFGWNVLPTPDIDGDGAADLLVSELLGGSTGEGIVWVISGGLAARGAGDAETAALLAWSGEVADAYTGNALSYGDPDGDGVVAFVVSAYTYPDSSGNTAGRVYVLR